MLLLSLRSSAGVGDADWPQALWGRWIPGRHAEDQPVDVLVSATRNRLAGCALRLCAVLPRRASEADTNRSMGKGQGSSALSKDGETKQGSPGA